MTEEDKEEINTSEESTSPSEEENTEEQKNDKQLSDGESDNFKWYVIHVLSGQENKVKKALIERIFNHNLQESFSRVFVPEENVVSQVGGKKRNIKKRFFPGYILIKMVMNDDTWHLVKSTDKITGFIGANKNKPSPISEEEAKYITNQEGEGFKKHKSTINFSEGDNVRVTEGPFASFVGTVEQVTEKGKIKVQVSIFGRPTPVELDFTQVEKV